MSSSPKKRKRKFKERYVGQTLIIQAQYVSLCEFNDCEVTFASNSSVSGCLFYGNGQTTGAINLGGAPPPDKRTHAQSADEAYEAGYLDGLMNQMTAFVMPVPMLVRAYEMGFQDGLGDSKC